MEKIFNKYWPHIIILLFSFLLYGNTLNYDYTLDDLMVIKDNAFTQKGISGIKEIFSYDSFTGFFGKEKKLVVGGRYRPFSIATFAIEFQIIGGFSAFFSHLINILLYAFTGIVIYLSIKKISNSKNSGVWSCHFPIIVSVLFLSHPVHTEVVANIKGRDELLAFLFPMLSLWLLLLYIDKGKLILLIFANLLLFLGLLSKENAISFIILIPVTLYFFTGVSLKQNLTLGLSLLFTACVFLFVRFLVLGYMTGGKIPGELLNNPFLEATSSQKFGTILYTLGLYLKLLFFPLTLTHDYYPYHIPLVELFSFKALFPLFLYSAIILFAIINNRKNNWFSYSVWLYLIPLSIVSNIVFPVGTFMNERFIYMSSFGFAIALAYLIIGKFPEYIKNKAVCEKTSFLVLITILLLFSLRTVSRNVVWKDNFTLFTSDVDIARNSVKCNIAAGGEWMKQAEKEADSSDRKIIYEKSLVYLEKAIQLYPKATNGLILYGNALATFKKEPKQAIEQYMKVLSYDPYESNAFGNSIKVLNSLDNKKELDYKIGKYIRLWEINRENNEVNYALGKLYGQFKGNLDSSCFFLERSVALAPNDVAAYKDLGIVYSLKGDYLKSIEMFSKARSIAPEDQSILQNIMITNQIMQLNKKNKPN